MREEKWQSSCPVFSIWNPTIFGKNIKRKKLAHFFRTMVEPKLKNRYGDVIGEWTEEDLAKHFPLHLFVGKPTLAQRLYVTRALAQTGCSSWK